MSEDDARTTAPAGGETPVAASFGARLTAARERAGMTLTEVAARLRLHPNQVRALEAENLGALPEAAYVRGFLRSYARMVGIDAAPLLEDLNAKIAPQTGSVIDGMARTEDYSPVKAAAQEQISRLLVLSLAVITLIALGAVGWYATRQGGDEPSQSAGKTAGSASKAVAPAAATPPAPATDTAPVAPEKSAPASEAAQAASESAAPAAVAGGTVPALLTLQFNGVSWVEVTDANGKVLLSQLARPGELHQLNGVPPLAVVIGDASKAAVTVRGEPMNVEAIARANVARFTIK